MQALKNTLFSLFLATLIPAVTIARETTATPFPLDNYEQDIATWLNPLAPDYDDPVLPYQEQHKRLQEFYQHYYATTPGSLSPWCREHVEWEINQELTYLISSQLINKFNNSHKEDPSKIGYGINLLPHPPQWLEDIVTNMNLAQFALKAKYNPDNRAIAVKNLQARVLPTTDPYFYHHTLPGQGYPFDNLQVSAVWVGTPVYILGTTLDQAWHLVLTPHFMGWVPSDGVARTDAAFIAQWQKYAAQQLVAITKTNLGVIDNKQQYQFNAYIGSLFPGVKPTTTVPPQTIEILIPVADSTHHAQIAIAKLKPETATVMPLTATPRNFATIIASLLGRPYGWGNNHFYNDCSAELQALFTPFGIWLPRHSSAQLTAGEVVDISNINPAERLAYLQQYGKKLVTIVYLEGHVMLYIGTYPNPNSNTHEPVALVYHNIWGLRPEDSSYRAIIGKAVFTPLLLSYPEDPVLLSLAARKLFKLAFLDKPCQLPQKQFDVITKQTNADATELHVTQPNQQPQATY